MGVRQREGNLDLLRILATFSVVLIHINAHWFEKNAIVGNINLIYIMESSINLITRASVPIFVMISGAFLLENSNNKNFKGFYKKTSYKILLPLIVVIILLYIIGFALNLNGTSIKNSIIGVLIGSFYNLWFMYMLAGLYLMVPLIIRIKESVSNNIYRNIVFILVIWACISQLFLNDERLAYSIDVVFAFLSYFLLGDLMHGSCKVKMLFKHHRIFSIILLLVVYIITIGYRTFGSYNESIIFAPYVSFFSPSVIISSLLIFGLFLVKKDNRNYFYLSSKTYYIYLFHTIVYESIFKFCPFVNSLNELCAIVIIALCTFLLSFFISVIFSGIWSTLENKFNLKEKYYHLNIWK